jgi:transposase
VFELLLPVPGLDRLTIDVVIAETAADMGCFGSPAQLASWAGLCPGNHESAGKRRRVGTHPVTSGCGVPWSRPPAPPPAPRAPYFAAQYRQIARRRGPNKAAVAVAHSLLDLIWRLLRSGECFQDLGDDFFDRRDPEREARRLVHQLQQLGYSVTLATDAS